MALLTIDSSLLNSPTRRRGQGGTTPLSLDVPALLARRGGLAFTADKPKPPGIASAGVVTGFPITTTAPDGNPDMTVRDVPARRKVIHPSKAHYVTTVSSGITHDSVLVAGIHASHGANQHPSMNHETNDPKTAAPTSTSGLRAWATLLTSSHP